jgi:ADP-ribose pyrophosphatase YjhB (NUDIX family)
MKENAVTTRVQYAALPFRISARARTEFLLITSRETRRWIIPKGWPQKGRAPHRSAAREAFEEAGVLGSNSHRDQQGHVAVLKKARQVRTDKARQKAVSTMTAIADAQALGITTLRGIAHKLNEWGRTAPRGGKWRAGQVKAAIERFNASLAAVQVL